MVMTYIIQNRIIRICENEKDYGDQILQVDHFIKSCLFLISIIKSVMNSFFLSQFPILHFFYVAFQIIGKYLLFINCLLSISNYSAPHLL